MVGTVIEDLVTEWQQFINLEINTYRSRGSGWNAEDLKGIREEFKSALLAVKSGKNNTRKRFSKIITDLKSHRMDLYQDIQDFARRMDKGGDLQGEGVKLQQNIHDRRAERELRLRLQKKLVSIVAKVRKIKQSPTLEDHVKESWEDLQEISKKFHDYVEYIKYNPDGDRPKLTQLVSGLKNTDLKSVASHLKKAKDQIKEVLDSTLVVEILTKLEEKVDNIDQKLAVRHLDLLPSYEVASGLPSYDDAIKRATISGVRPTPG